MARAPPPSPVLVAAQERTIRHATSALFAIFAPSAASSAATANVRPSLSACLSRGARSPATIAQTLARSHLAGLGSQVTWHWNPRVQVGVRRNDGPPPLGRPWWRCSGSPGEAAAPLLPWRRSADTQDPSAPDRLLLGPRRGSAEDPTVGAGATSKNGCCKASAAVNREPGSHISRRKMRSMAGWPLGRGRTTSRDANFSLGGISGWRFAKDPSYSAQR